MGKRDRHAARGSRDTAWRRTPPPATPATPRRPRTVLRWVLTPLAVLLCALGVCAWIANPAFPRPPELEGVHLELPTRAPAAAALVALLRQDALAKLPPLVEQASRAVVKDGGWLESPHAVREAIARLRPAPDDLRRALLATGCLPEEARPLPSKQETISYLMLTRGVRLLAVRQVALAQEGRPDDAASELLALQARLLELEGAGCSPSLVAVMMIQLALGSVQRALAHALAHPALSLASQRALLAAQARLEARPSPMASAFRWEARWARQLIEQDFDLPPERRAEERLVWPWYDRPATLRISETLQRRHVWLAQQPLSATAAWTGAFPEEEHFQRLERQPALFSALRYNAVGLVLLGVGRPALRTYVLRWEQGRCLAAAQRARWTAELRQRGRTVADEVARRPALDPRTGTAFTGREVNSMVCAFPQQYTRDEALRMGAETRPLPPTPPPAPATGPASAPGG